MNVVNQIQPEERSERRGVCKHHPGRFEAVMTERVDRAEKVIAASAATIFHALTNRDSVAQWLPPDGATGEIHEFEARPGGPFRMTLHFNTGRTSEGKTTADSDTVNGRFVRLVPDSLVDQAVEFESDDPAFAGTMRMLWSLEPQGEASTLVRVEAHDVPRGIGRADHMEGLRSSLNNLEQWCARS